MAGFKVTTEGPQNAWHINQSRSPQSYGTVRNPNQYNPLVSAHVQDLTNTPVRPDPWPLLLCRATVCINLPRSLRAYLTGRMPPAKCPQAFLLKTSLS